MKATSIESKRREILFTNERLKEKLYKEAGSVLEIILQFENEYKQNIDNEVTSQAIVNLLEEGFKKEQLLFIKYKADVVKMLKKYPNLQKEKALDLFVTESDKAIVQSLIDSKSNIIIKLKNINSHGVGSVTIENFIVNDEFIMNLKVKNRIKTACTTYCQNEKQKLLKEFSERISEEVNRALKTGLISTKHYKLTASMLVDIDTGEIKYRNILRY